MSLAVILMFTILTLSLTPWLLAASPPAPLPVGSRVLVRREACLRIEPDPESACYASDSSSNGPRQFEVRGERSGMIEVLTVDDPSPACMVGAWPGAGARLVVYVLPDDLVPVLTRPWRQESADGTWVEAWPGLPVGEVAYAALGLRLDLRPPADHVSLAWVPGDDVPEAPAGRRIGSEIPTANGQLSALGQPITAAEIPWGWTYDELLPEGGYPRTTLVTLRFRRCLVLRARTTTFVVGATLPDWDPTGGALGGVLGGVIGGVVRVDVQRGGFAIPAGAPVFWRTGAEAGHATGTITFQACDPGDRLSCHPIDPGPRDWTQPHICTPCPSATDGKAP